MTHILHYGTFDVPNYGDLLFPLVSRKRLAGLGVPILTLSPAGGPPALSDCVPAIGVGAFADHPRACGVLIGGGNIISFDPARAPVYPKHAESALGYPDLWLTAARSAPPGTPVCWNAPGVPAPFTEWQQPYVAECLRRSSYISVRDEESRGFLLEALPDADVAVVPDTAWEVSELWTDEALRQSREAAFRDRDQSPCPHTIVVHLNSRYLASLSDQEVAARLDDLAREWDARIVLIAMGACHGDDELARRIGGAMQSKPLIVDKPRSLLEIASLIAHARGYVGSSMHGLITALSFGVPGLCVADARKPKFQGLRRFLGCEDMLATSWDAASQRLRTIDMPGNRSQWESARRRAAGMLDRHWDRVASLLRQRLGRGQTAASPAPTDPAGVAAYRADLAGGLAMANLLRYERERKMGKEKDAKLRAMAERVRALTAPPKTAGAALSRPARKAANDASPPPTVDILLATYCGESFLAAQIESLLAQTHPGWRLLARDDCSTDNTMAILTRYAQSFPDRMVLLPADGHLGACANFGRLLERSSAPYVMFCDQDDIWLPQKIERSLARMQKIESRQGFDIPILVYSDLLPINEACRPLGRSYWRVQNLSPHKVSLHRLLVQNVPMGCTMILNRALADQCIPISPAAVMHDHWVSLVAAAFGVLSYLDESTVLYRQHKTNYTGVRPWAGRRIWRSLAKGLGAYRRRCYQYVEQAAALRDRFGGRLGKKDLSAVRALADLRQAGPFGKRLRLVRHRMFKQGLVRNLAQLLVV